MKWTTDKDGTLWPLGRFIGQYAKEIADAHNAALKAERERVRIGMGFDAVIETNQQLRDQLADANTAAEAWRLAATTAPKGRRDE